MLSHENWVWYNPLLQLFKLPTSYSSDSSFKARWSLLLTYIGQPSPLTYIDQPSPLTQKFFSPARPLPSCTPSRPPPLHLPDPDPQGWGGARLSPTNQYQVAFFPLSPKIQWIWLLRRLRRQPHPICCQARDSLGLAMGHDFLLGKVKGQDKKRPGWIWPDFLLKLNKGWKGLWNGPGTMALYHPSVILISPPLVQRSLCPCARVVTVKNQI
jgi:hypothetical protein